MRTGPSSSSSTTGGRGRDEDDDGANPAPAVPPATVMTVAVVGSSGGGAATLGHTDPTELLSTIHRELGRVRLGVKSKSVVAATVPAARGVAVVLGRALFVSLHGGGGLDSAASDPDGRAATLFAVGCGRGGESDAQGEDEFRVRAVLTGTLGEVNEACRRLDDSEIAPAIVDGEVGGLVCISADPLGVNSASVSAAARMGIPVTGSGGTRYGIQFVGNAGGSVATTSYTRAVSFCHALSTSWEGATYDPLDDIVDGAGRASAAGRSATRPHIRSVLEACLPAFVAVCVACRAIEPLHQSLVMTADGDDLTAPSGGMTGDERSANLSGLLWHLRHTALPAACCVTTAHAYAPEHGSTALMAASVASAGCSGSILGGLLAGWMVAWLVGRTMFACIRWGIPATMTNVVVAGGVGTFVALGLELTGAVRVLSWVTHMMRSILHGEMDAVAAALGSLPLPLPPRLAVVGDRMIRLGRIWDWWERWGGRGTGFAFGCIFCYGSRMGWYHSIFLPVILIEMERGDASLWGAVDECTLCLVSAGICAANLILAPTAEAAGCRGKDAAEKSTNDGVDGDGGGGPGGAGGGGGDAAISRRGLRINLLCGDFIEAAYPYMERSPIVNVGAHVAAGVSTEILFRESPDEVLSSAYLPLPICVWLARDRTRMATASVAAFGISLLGGLVGNAVGRIRFEDERKRK